MESGVGIGYQPQTESHPWRSGALTALYQHLNHESRCFYTTVVLPSNWVWRYQTVRLSLIYLVWFCVFILRDQKIDSTRVFSVKRCQAINTVTAAKLSQRGCLCMFIWTVPFSLSKKVKCYVTKWLLPIPPSLSRMRMNGMLMSFQIQRL